jgi:hypothetical protein
MEADPGRLNNPTGHPEHAAPETRLRVRLEKRAAVRSFPPYRFGSRMTRARISLISFMA